MTVRSVSNSLKTSKCLLILILIIIFLILWSKKPSEKKSDASPDKIIPRPRPWFFSDGNHFPKPAAYSTKLGRRDAKLMPDEDPNGYRFEEQLMFVPPNYAEIVKSNETKTIVIYNGQEGWWQVGDPTTVFERRKCPVKTCRLTLDKEEAETADLILFSGQHQPPDLARTSNQIYAFYRLESPIHWFERFTTEVLYNWTVTYRHDSTIPIPYSKWIYYDPRIRQKHQDIDYAANKTKKVAILVSNCDAHNDRLQYVQQLQKHIQVDIYGKCGTLDCGDTNRCLEFFEREYKFYLAFENSHCADYVTEKLFRNALRRRILPVVLGARAEDYKRQAPENSYIFVEDFHTAKDLADYLKKVDQDDTLYNSYFKWKGTGEIIWPFDHMWCRMCALLHDNYSMEPHWYPDINKWWFDPNTLRRGFWRDTN